MTRGSSKNRVILLALNRCFIELLVGMACTRPGYPSANLNILRITPKIQDAVQVAMLAARIWCREGLCSIQMPTANRSRDHAYSTLFSNPEVTHVSVRHYPGPARVAFTARAQVLSTTRAVCWAHLAELLGRALPNVRLHIDTDKELRQKWGQVQDVRQKKKKNTSKSDPRLKFCRAL